jgi:hypothetical protein
LGATVRGIGIVNSVLAEARRAQGTATAFGTACASFGVGGREWHRQQCSRRGAEAAENGNGFWNCVRRLFDRYARGASSTMFSRGRGGAGRSTASQFSARDASLSATPALTRAVPTAVAVPPRPRAPARTLFAMSVCTHQPVSAHRQHFKTIALPPRPRAPARKLLTMIICTPQSQSAHRKHSQAVALLCGPCASARTLFTMLARARRSGVSARTAQVTQV